MTIRRTMRGLDTRLRMAAIGVRAVASPRHPILVHVVPIRRCNLSCTYCTEYDDHSPPVPTDVMLERIEHLGRLGSAMVCFSGGEPLLHPDLDVLIGRTRELGMFAELLTNGYLLVPERIRRLNRAGLNRLQISVDNVTPDEVSKKSLKVLDSKLVALATHAEFDVNINSVLGGGVQRAEDALEVTERARALGFSSTVGILHDGDGQLKPLSQGEKLVYDRIRATTPPLFTWFTSFKDNLARGEPTEWRCRAGARYLYVCEDGLVHYCSQQRGRPGTPLLTYTKDDIAREFDTAKSCAPYCTVSCVHAVAVFDQWRGPQRSVAAPLPQNGIVQLGLGPRAPTPTTMGQQE